MKRRPSTRLERAIDTLRRVHGVVQSPIATDPFALILWEQVGYLVDDARRRKAFERLETETGLTPEGVLETSKSKLVAIAKTAGTIAANERAERMRTSALLVVEEWSGDLTTLLDLPLADAKRGLKKFPMIGDAGAERILLIARRLRALPLESNGLRVLLRLGYGHEAKSYATTYRSVQTALGSEIREDYRWLWKAHQLLRQHGQRLCKSTSPRCVDCPLTSGCRFYSSAGQRV